jgi:hypothetical protein
MWRLPLAWSSLLISAVAGAMVNLAFRRPALRVRGNWRLDNN